MIWLLKSFKNLLRRTTFDKVLCDKAFNTAKSLKYDEYQHRFGSMLYNFFDIKPLVLLLTQAQELILKSNYKNYKNYTSQLLENLKSVKYIHPLRTILGMLPYQIYK